MANPRFIVHTSHGQGPKEQLPHAGSVLELGPNESHHLASVLRLRIADTVEIFYPEHQIAFLCSVLVVSPSASTLTLLEALPSAERHHVHMIVGVVKPAKLELVVEKCTELGVQELQFFFAERSQHPRSGNDLVKKIDRLLRVRDAALKQSHSTASTQIDIHSDLAAVLQRLHPVGLHPVGTHPVGTHPDESAAGQHRIICAAPKPATGTQNNSVNELNQPETQVPLITALYQKPAAVFSDTSSQANAALENISQPVESYIVIGPEGGFTSSELELAKSYRYRQASLGPTVLRSETAVIIAAGLAQVLGLAVR